MFSYKPPIKMRSATVLVTVLLVIGSICISATPSSANNSQTRDVHVFAGMNHACAVVTENGTSKPTCWGSDWWGQVSGVGQGNGDTNFALGDYRTCFINVYKVLDCVGNADFANYIPAAERVPGFVSAVASGNGGTCALNVDSTVTCWTDTSDTTFGIQNVPAGIKASQVTVGGNTVACALLIDSTVRCWGDNWFNQLSVPRGLSGVTQIVAGVGHVCALKSSGTVVCWGINDQGQIAVPSGLNAVTKISGNGWTVCALKSNGFMSCWGDNSSGQLDIPSDLGPVSDIAVGGRFSCAVDSASSIKCWGTNTEGQSTPPPLDDISVETVHHYSSNKNKGVYVPPISTLGYNTCVVKSDTTVACWGQKYGKAPVITQMQRLPERHVLNTNCEIVNGNVKCMGSNQWGALGASNSDLNLWSRDWVTVSGLSNVIQIDSDQWSGTDWCALTSSGQVYCWGRIAWDNTAKPYDWSGYSNPVLVTGVSGAVQIATGDGSACALLSTGQVKCWGYNYQGQLGRGASKNFTSFSPAVVSGLPSNPVGIAMDGYDTFVVAANYQVYVFGMLQFSSLPFSGDYTDANVEMPTLIPGMTLSNTYNYYGAPASAPHISTVSAANKQAEVNFAAPTDDGGATITNYEYSSDGGITWYATSPAQTSSPLVITGLKNGTAYSVMLRAVNLAGSGAASNAISVTPQTTASAPTISSVASGNHYATVSLTAPADNGGAVITNYEYTTDGGSTWAAASPGQTSSPLVISGLTNGTTYSVKLRAVNNAGSGAESNAVSVKPIAPASAPTISGVVAGNGQATLSITAPSQINDSSLTGYDYSTNNGSTWSRFSSATGPFTITGLTNATAYQVKVRAVNSAGAGEASATVTVNPTRLVPAKPVIASVVGGNTSATVNITTPTDVTAQSITGYQYSIDKGATYQNAVVSNGSFIISGLTNGVSTSVQIRATNFNGTSLASVAKSVIPSTTPAAPSITTITPTTGALSIAFTAPNTGGSAITGYQYSLDGGLTWVVPKAAVKSSPIRVTGLPNATTYQVSIRAVNAKGAGSASTAVSSTTPVLVPSAPVVTSISKTRTTITIDFDAPVNNGGGTITNYAYSTDRGRTWAVVSPASAATRVVITGLNPSTLYPVQIAAINSAGRGASSALTGVGTLH